MSGVERKSERRRSMSLGTGLNGQVWGKKAKLYDQGGKEGVAICDQREGNSLEAGRNQHRRAGELGGARTH